jgi:ribosomal protein S18 acetylase RimI-like enzyme
MTVRKFRETDFPGIENVYANSKLDELKFEGRSFTLIPLREAPAVLAAFIESDVIVYEDGRVLGFAATFSGQLRALFVHADARRHGIGQALLNAVIAKEIGPISLNVAKSNVLARTFYERYGFAVVGEITRQYDGIDVVYSRMTRKSE